ncbi:hypothetical protein B1808_10460 [Pseudofulvimonas gallinarii]|nr:hypothetical protein B1808_10460 [Pseudofulvimonas gallinarii]
MAAPARRSPVAATQPVEPVRVATGGGEAHGQGGGCDGGRPVGFVSAATNLAGRGPENRLMGFPRGTRNTPAG